MLNNLGLHYIWNNIRALLKTSKLLAMYRDDEDLDVTLNC